VTTPGGDDSDEQQAEQPEQAGQAVEPGQEPGGPGAEVGMTDGEGSTFEPEEDPGDR
jgi:hypothetical protein